MLVTADRGAGIACVQVHTSARALLLPVALGLGTDQVARLSLC